MIMILKTDNDHVLGSVDKDHDLVSVDNNHALVIVDNDRDLSVLMMIMILASFIMIMINNFKKTNSENVSTPKVVVLNVEFALKLRNYRSLKSLICLK